MGQCHIIVNLTKHEYLLPPYFGDGPKLLEFGASGDGTMTGLAILLAASNGRGGGDCDDTTNAAGSWAGDRIAIIGDYVEPGDIPGFTDQDFSDMPEGERSAYWFVRKFYKEVSDKVLPIIADCLNLVFYRKNGAVRVVDNYTTEGRAKVRKINPDHIIAGRTR